MDLVLQCALLPCRRCCRRCCTRNPDWTLTLPMQYCPCVFLTVVFPREPAPCPMKCYGNGACPSRLETYSSNITVSSCECAQHYRSSATCTHVPVVVSMLQSATTSIKRTRTTWAACSPCLQHHVHWHPSPDPVSLAVGSSAVLYPKRPWPLASRSWFNGPPSAW